MTKLEDQFMSEWSSEIASSKLGFSGKNPFQTYQALEADISEFVMHGTRNVYSSTRSQWMYTKGITVFKQAIDANDQQLLYTENQNRFLNGLKEMDLC